MISEERNPMKRRIGNLKKLYRTSLEGGVAKLPFGRVLPESPALVS
jgi:hypothetical protein